MTVGKQGNQYGTATKGIDREGAVTLPDETFPELDERNETLCTGRRSYINKRRTDSHLAKTAGGNETSFTE